jgi:DNA (cytosine-5)-methyltransferase 1
MKPRLLDLFCGAGGAAMGYHRAGFEVVGVDIKPQPHYPFEFIQADALDELVLPGFERFDAVHASPPCQAFTRAKHLRTAQGGETEALDLIEPTRRLLRRLGLPYVIENVPGAPLHGVTICGSTFGLKVRRHRVFESNVYIPPLPCNHKFQGRPVGVYHVLNDHVPQGGTTASTLEEGQEAMGIDWMTWAELKEAIPPAYTKWIGHNLISVIERERAA